MNKQRIDIGVAIHGALFREAFSGSVQASKEISVIHAYENGTDLIKAIKSTGKVPEVCIIDLNVIDNYETVDRLKKMYPNMKVLVLASSFTEYMLEIMISYGANGFVSKDSSIKEVIKAVKTVHQKNYYYTPTARKPLFTKILKTKASIQPLSYRQGMFLQYCAKTAIYSEIAKAMELSPRTIDNNRDAVFARFKVKDKGDMIIAGIRSGLIFVD